MDFLSMPIGHLLIVFLAGLALVLSWNLKLEAKMKRQEALRLEWQVEIGQDIARFMVRVTKDMVKVDESMIDLMEKVVKLQDLQLKYLKEQEEEEEIVVN